MDAAHKLIKTAGLLFAVALLLAVPGWSQTTLNVSSASVSLSGTGGQTVSVTSSGSPITYTTATVYSSDSGSSMWLAVSGGTTTPAQLTFSIFNTAGLSQGTHTATVTLTPTDPAILAVPITVTYSSGQGTTGTLQANPNPVNISATPGSQFTTNVTISTTSTTSITLGAPVVSVSNGGTNWLAATFLGASSVVFGSTATIQVTATAATLTTGTYNGTVTVTSSSGSSLTIPVNFIVGGGTGNGTWTVSPTSIPFTYNSGGAFQSSSMVVTTTSGNTSYTATASSSNGWLLVNGSPSFGGLTVGQSYPVSVGAQAQSLTTGAYTGTITIADPFGVTQTTLTVTLSVNGGNSFGLTINPNPLNLTSAVNGAQQNPVVNITSSTGGALTISANFQSWLYTSVPANTTLSPNAPYSLSLSVNPAGLGVGTYGQSINITVGSQSSVLTVSLVVGSGTGGGGGTVTPNSLTFTYQQNTLPAAVAQQKIVIPAGAWTSNITYSTGSNWLAISPLAGTSVPDSASSPTVYVTATGLAVGSYSGNVAITVGGSTQNVAVTLTVTSAPVLVPTPGSLVFTTQTGSVTPGQSVFWSTTDQVNAPVNITASTSTSWITVSGSTPSSFSVAVDPTGLAAGVYSGSITVIQSGVANSPYTYPVTMIVNGGGSGGGGPLSFVPASLSFSTTNGVTSPSSTTLNVSANVSTNFTFTTSVSGNVNNWIVVSPSSNGNGSGVTSTNLSVSVNPAGLSAGTYNGFINFNANGINQTVSITLTVNNTNTGGNVTVNPTSLTFAGQAGTASIASQSITVSSASSSAPVIFTVTPTTSSGGSWLTTNASASNSTPVTLNVTANPAGLAAGTYNGNLAIQPTGGSLVNVPITLTITAPPTVTASPTQLNFTYRSGDPAPAAQTINVTGGSSSLTYSATAASTGNWLVVQSSTGTTPGTVSVTVNAGSLQAGSYSGTVTIAGTNGATGTTTVTVNLTVTVPLPTITKVTNAASYVTASLSPGEIITLFASDPAHPIGPSTPAGLTLDSTGKVATTLGGVQVLVSGFLAPLIYVSASQVSAVVPYELAPFTSATVLVKYQGQSSNGVTLNMTTTAPGLFTLNSSGTGPGAILNSNNSVNGPGTGATSPATRGDTVVVYLTGEGQTSPAGVTGKVTTVSSTPPLTPGPLLPVSVTVGGQPANWTFAGEAPGFVSGVMQLNVVTPTNVAAGDQEILVTIGGNTSQRGVTVSLK
jgi:uncharacterized protein (TIGR03437 family)